MLLYSVIIAILLLMATVVRFFYRFAIIRVNGDSMFPTFKDGQLRVMDTKMNPRDLDAFDSLTDLEGRIFVAVSPDGKLIIKRLIYISENAGRREYWLEGDNPDNSQDSRHWGFLFSGGLVGEVVGWKEFLQRLIFTTPYQNTKNSRERNKNDAGNSGNAGKL